MKNRFYYIIWGAIAFILYIEMYVSVRFQSEYGAQMVPKAIALMSPFVLVQGLLFFALYALTVKEEVKIEANKEVNAETGLDKKSTKAKSKLKK